MRIMFICLFVLISACGNIPLKTNLEIQPYLDNIQSICDLYSCNKDIKNYPVIFVDNIGGEKDYIGYCDPSKTFIKINKTQFEELNENQKTFLLIHELGHCLFNKEHTDNVKNIMNHDIVSLSLYYSSEEDKTIYLDEYFK